MTFTDSKKRFGSTATDRLLSPQDLAAYGGMGETADVNRPTTPGGPPPGVIYSTGGDESYGGPNVLGDYSRSGAPATSTYNPAAVSDKDPGGMALQDRQMAYAEGGAIAGSLQNRANQAGLDEGYFQKKAIDQYNPILSGQGGYDADTTKRILNDERLKGLEYTPEQAQELQLTGDEQAAMLGDPEKARAYYDPSTTDQIENDAGRYVRAERDAGNDALQNMTGEVAASQRGAIDPTALKMDRGVAAGVNRTVGTAGTNVRDAINYNDLHADTTGMRMTDAQREAIINKSQRQVGNQYRAAQQDLQMRAAASGNASPLAVAAARARLDQQSAVDSADARANAEVGADAAQRKTLMDAEGLRMQGANNYAGLRSNAELSLADLGVNSALSSEKTRLGAEQSLTGYLSDAEKNIAAQRLAAEKNKQDVGVSTELELAARKQAANQANQNTGIALQQQIDAAGTQRAGTVATNRQGATQFAQQQKANQGFGVADRSTANATTVANQKKAEEAEGRGFLTGQQSQASNNVNTANAQRIENYGTMTGAANTATRNNQNYQTAKDASGWGSVLKGVVGGVASAATKKAFGG
jgi:hypothetical protein